MSDYKLNFNLEKAIYDFCSNVSDIVTLAEKTKHMSPEVNGDFISYSVLAPKRVGRDELIYKSADKYEIRSIRIVPVEIRVYSQDAFDKGLQLEMALSKPSVIEAYFSSYGFLEDTRLSDISAFLETGYETRALLEFSLTYPVTVEDDLGYIGKVELNSTVNTLLDNIESDTEIGG